MKKLTSLLLCLALLLGLTPALAAGETLDIRRYDETTRTYSAARATRVGLVLDGAALTADVPAMLVDGRTLVPVRALAEALGAQVLWVAETRQAILRRGATTVVLTLGSATALVNGQEAPLPGGVSAQGIYYAGASCTMAPLRFVAETLGAVVEWDAASVTASIVSPAAAGAALVTGVVVDAQAGTVLIASTAAPEYVVTDFGDRVAVDVLDATLPAGAAGVAEEAALGAGTPALTAVRYRQHGPEFLPGSGQTLRVVLDLGDGVSYRENVTVAPTAEGILLTVTAPAENGGEGEETPEEPYAFTTPQDPGRYTIAIDPGHGGNHYGAIHEGIPEKTINLAVAQLLRDRLEELGYQVVMTIDGDETKDLYERSDVANAAGADIFISLHSNALSNNDLVQGLIVYHYPTSTRGRKLAQTIQTAACQVSGAFDRGILSENFVVVRETTMAAVLVEMGFMTNHEELMRLIDPEYQRKLAWGVAEGAVQYLNQL